MSRVSVIDDSERCSLNNGWSEKRIRCGPIIDREISGPVGGNGACGEGVFEVTDEPSRAVYRCDSELCTSAGTCLRQKPVNDVYAWSRHGLIPLYVWGPH